MATPVIKGLSNIRHYAFDGTLTVPLYCLMYHDSNDVKPAASQTDQGSEIANQRLFASNFAGLSAESRAATDTDADTDFPIITEEIVDIDCASATWEVGDLVAIDEASSGTALENQKVVKTTDPTCAIGHCVKREASATTTVRVLLEGKHAEVDNSPFKSVVQVIAYDDLTDGGSTAGTLTLTDSLPAGAFVIGWEAVTATGWTGDSSATLQVGDGSDADRFSSVTTGSIFAAGTIGSQPKDGVNAYCAAATNIGITVTSGSDFTSVAAGSTTLRVYYITP